MRNENALIWEAFKMNPTPLKDLFVLEPDQNGWIIRNKSKRTPFDVVARFDADQGREAQKRWEYLSKGLSPADISQGFKDLRASLHENPEDFKTGNKSVSWTTRAKLIAPYMFLGGKWFIGNNVSQWFNGRTHVAMFSDYMGITLLDLVKKKDQKGVQSLISQYKFLQSHEQHLIEQIWDTPEYVGSMRDVIWRIMIDSADDNTIEEIRVKTKSGRLWIDPFTTSNEQLYGLFLSSWVPLSPVDKQHIVNSLTPILNQKGYKWNQVVWDGDEYIDPTHKHLAASRIKLPNALSWDDIKYQ